MAMKRFVVTQALWGALLNSILNGPPILLFLPDDTSWHLWRGFPSLILDTIAMAFGIAWGIGWLNTIALRKQIAAGKAEVVTGLSERWQIEFGKWPRSAMHRGINLGGFAVLLFGLPMIALLFAFRVESWGPWGIMVFHTVYGLVLGAVFTPVTALGVVAEERVVLDVPASTDTAM